jgi:hypothetical protein
MTPEHLMIVLVTIAGICAFFAVLGSIDMIIELIRRPRNGEDSDSP